MDGFTPKRSRGRPRGTPSHHVPRASIKAVEINTFEANLAATAELIKQAMKA